MVIMTLTSWFLLPGTFFDKSTCVVVMKKQLQTQLQTHYRREIQIFDNHFEMNSKNKKIDNDFKKKEKQKQRRGKDDEDSENSNPEDEMVFDSEREYLASLRDRKRGQIA